MFSEGLRLDLGNLTLLEKTIETAFEIGDFDKVINFNNKSKRKSDLSI